MKNNQECTFNIVIEGNRQCNTLHVNEFKISTRATNHQNVPSIFPKAKAKNFQILML